MWTLFTLSSLSADRRFCRSTLHLPSGLSKCLTNTHWLCEKLPQKSCSMSHTASKLPCSVLQEQPCQSCHHLSLLCILFPFSPSFYSWLHYTPGVTLHFKNNQSAFQMNTSLSRVRTNPLIHWLNFNSQKPAMIYYIFYLFKKPRLTSQRKQVMLAMY